MITELRSANFLSDVAGNLRNSDSASIAVAFATESGIRLQDIFSSLEDAVHRRCDIRIAVDLLTGNTDPAAVWLLRSLASRAGNVRFRALLPTAGRLLHAKFYFFRTGGEVCLITGSANLSGPGYTENVEHGVLVRGSPDEPVLADASRFFDELWNAPDACDVDDEAARLYEEFCGRLRVTRRRSRSRARAAWERLEHHLRLVVRETVVWPSPSVAYVLGAIAARGQLNDVERSIKIQLRYSPRSYPTGEVRLGRVGYGVEVLSTIPSHLSRELSDAIPAADVTVSGQTISVDLGGHPQTYDTIRSLFRGATNTHEYRLPEGLADASEDTVVEFIRGFAAASALVTDHTSLPGDRLTGLPGIQTVWLRPQTGNRRLFDELQALIERRLGIKVYTQWREYREPHLKIRCEDFQERIGFGLTWWDELVAAGADYNDQMFGRQPPLALT